jgi:hypothetical protein
MSSQGKRGARGRDAAEEVYGTAGVSKRTSGHTTRAQWGDSPLVDGKTTTAGECGSGG